MNLTQIENKLDLIGYGFHDATILSINVDYISKSAILALSVFLGTTEDKKTITLNLLGLKYFTIDPPDPTYNFTGSGLCDIMDDPEYRLLYKNTLNKSDFIAKFWMNDWNSCIHLASSDSDITLK